jgi:putative ABC transport system permease protein
MIKTFGYNFKIAYEAILQNKLRSILTSLGIICGVASVIAMLAIGKGAEEEILEKMKLLGTNNIIIEPLTVEDKKEANSGNESSDAESSANEKEITKFKFSPGLNIKDVKSLVQMIDEVETASPEIIVKTTAISNGFKVNSELIGIQQEYFELNPNELAEGTYFTSEHHSNSMPVCIIGAKIRAKLFATQKPIGGIIKCKGQWLKVIGVIRDKYISKENISNLGLRDYNYDVYIPISSMLLRFENRSLVTKQDLARRQNETQVKDNYNYHQLDKVVLQIKNSENVETTARIINKMLKRRHFGVEDYKIIVPLTLLEQEQRTKQIFNFVLGAIASISLLVGGIGIMNIMLASVLERTKEIGVRRAVGAKQKDIMVQFLSEAVAISFTGGIIGVIIGVSVSLGIEKATDIQTIVSLDAVLLSFIVSISVGLIFGIAPARKASLQSPIELLRYE